MVRLAGYGAGVKALWDWRRRPFGLIGVSIQQARWMIRTGAIATPPQALAARCIGRSRCGYQASARSLWPALGGRRGRSLNSTSRGCAVTSQQIVQRDNRRHFSFCARRLERNNPQHEPSMRAGACWGRPGLPNDIFGWSSHYLNCATTRAMRPRVMAVRISQLFSTHSQAWDGARYRFRSRPN